MVKHMEINNLLKNARVCRALTSLNPAEFEQLLFPFEAEWQRLNARKTFGGAVRQRKVGAGCKGRLVEVRRKMLFILMYFKLYPIQEAMAFIWGMSQTQVCDWIHRLTPVLQTALGRELKLPERQPAKLHEVLRACSELRFIIDGTERRTRRPQGKNRQKAHYSGKKKTHTRKNVLITSGRRVVYMTQTQPGSCHDKKLAAEIERRRFPKGSVLLQDSGFLGFNPQGACVVMPDKKPRGGTLDSTSRMYNRIIAHVRVRVEHVISGVKRCRIVSDIFRNMKEGFDDAVMEVACGLHNFRVDARATT